MNEPIIKGLFVGYENELNADEKALAEAAAMPDLHEITPELLDSLRSESQNNITMMLQGSGVFAAVLVLAILLKAYNFAISVGITIAVVLIAAYITHLCSNIDETAAVMTLPVHHIEDGKFRSKVVCYLPDGKYLFPMPKTEADPETVTVITCNGFTKFKFNRKVEKS